jgi:HEAT repeats
MIDSKVTLHDPTGKIRFTGWESDQFVLFARRVLDLGLAARVAVHGREPITSTPVRFDGELVDATWHGYRRTITVQLADGSQFEMGGTNTTRSISTETLWFTGVDPEQIGVGRLCSPSDLDSLSHDSPSDAVAGVLESLDLAVRWGAFDSTALNGSVVVSSGLGSHESPSVRIAVARILVHARDSNALVGLAGLLADSDVRVRREAALRLRTADKLLQQLGDSSIVAFVIDALRGALHDDDSEVRVYAAEVLGYFYNDEAIRDLQYTVASDTSTDVRWAATIALGRTNGPDVGKWLLTTLRTDEAIEVKRAALLSLGRLGASMSQNDRELVADCASALARLVEEAGPNADYAAYALGELGAGGAQYANVFVRSITSGRLDVASCSVMSLAKLVPFLDSDSPEWLETVSTALTSIARTSSQPHSWPENGFYRWLLGSAGDLCTALDLFEPAAVFFRKASSASGPPGWLARYYVGVAQFSQAEDEILSGNIGFAVGLLEQAVDALDAVAREPDFSSAESGRSGLRLKQTLAHARLDMVKGALRLQTVSGLAGYDFADERQMFMRAAESYQRLDITNLSDSQRGLTPRESAIVAALQLLSAVALDAVELARTHAMREHLGIEFALATARASIRRFISTASSARSTSVTKMSERLGAALASCEGPTTGWTDVEAAINLIGGVSSALLGSLPVPGACPVVTFGQATMTISLPDAIGGDGTAESPLLVPHESLLRFNGFVNVLHRTKDDQLILTVDGPGIPGAQAVQFIPVHEGRYALRPIGFGTLVSSKVETPFTFRLSFRNRGCLQPVQDVELWVRSLPSGRDDEIPRDDLRTELKRIDSALKDERASESAINSSPATAQNVVLRIKAIQERITKLELRKSEIDAILHARNAQ